jgi:hypothetical protein
LDELGHQPALPQPGVGDHPNHLPVTAAGVGERIV